MKPGIWLLCIVAAVAARPAAAQSATTFGPNLELVAGAEALGLGHFEQGLAHTRLGLLAPLAADERAAALSNLCAGYVGLGLYDIAIVHCSEAVELDPGHWQAYNNRALAYLGKGMYSLARRDVRLGLDLAPESRSLQESLHLVEEAAHRAGDRPEPDPVVRRDLSGPARGPTA